MIVVRCGLLFRRLLLLIVVAVLVAGCGGDGGVTDATPVDVPTSTTTEDTKTTVDEKPPVEPEGDVPTEESLGQKEPETANGESTESTPATVEQPDTEVDEPAPVRTEEETSTVEPSELEEAETVVSESTESTPATMEEPETEVVETPEDPTEEVVEPTEPEVVEEVAETEPVDEVSVYQQSGPLDSEIPTLVTHSPEEIIWWYPDLMQDGYDLVDPNSVESDSWDSHQETSGGLAPHHSHYVFYHGDRLSSLKDLWRSAAEGWFWSYDWYYFPVRFDVSWEDRTAARVVGTYPLGETWTLRVSPGGVISKLVGERPEGPPLAPLPPFTEPDYPEFAVTLGRNCPSAEVLWARRKSVRDPCTLVALQNAVQFALAAATVEQSEAAIRDGWALVDVIQERKDLDNANPFNAYWYDPDNPGYSTVELRNIAWAAGWAGASRIRLDFRVYARPSETTPEFQQQIRDHLQGLLDEGYEVPEEWLGEELPAENEGFWDSALMVRTADGTWRMGYAKWCVKMEGTGFPDVEGKPLDCPEDPNPVWSDDLASIFLFPPNTVYYWEKATPEQQQWSGRPPS